MQRNEVGFGQQSVEARLFDAHFDGTFGGQERVEGNDLHFQTERAAGDNRTDIARADQAQRFACEFDPHEAVFFPLAGLCRCVGFWKLARQCEHQRYRMFGGSDRIAERRVHDDHAFCRC